MAAEGWHKPGNAESTPVNEQFSDEHNADIGHYGQTLINIFKRMLEKYIADKAENIRNNIYTEAPMMGDYIIQSFFKGFLKQPDYFMVIYELSTDGLPGKIMDISDSALQLLGYSRDVILSKSLMDIVSHETLDLTIFKDIKQGELFLTTYNYLSSEARNVNCETWNIYFTENSKALVFCLSHDISRIKSEQDHLAESESQLKMLLENSGDGIGIVDEKEIFLYANPAAESIFGLGKGGLKGRSLLEFIDEDKINEILFQTLNRKAGIKNRYELEIVTPEKTRKLLQINATPKKNSKGKVIGTVGVFRDVTRQKEAEKVLIESEKRLKELNASKDKFFSIIGHDLRSPFSSILGFTELLLMEYDRYDDETIKKYLALIYESSTLSFNLLENLLEWARSQTNRIKYSPENVNLRFVADEVIRIINISVRSKEIIVLNQINQNIQVTADKNMLNTILRNLLSNAIKFSPRKSTITFCAVNARNFIEIHVKDNGSGMSPHVVKELFNSDAFFSTEGTEKEKGTGLGLYLCQEFAKKNGGTIWVESIEGKGSDFIFTLPVYMIPEKTELIV